MYKTLTFDQLVQIKTPFFSNLKKIYEKEGFVYFKQFLKKVNEDIVDEIMYLSSAEVYFRIVLQEGNLEIIDEKNAIKLKLDEETISKIHNYLKKKDKSTGKQNIANTLIRQFEENNMKDILGKHFIVYDIETIGNIQNLQNTKFMIAYAIDSKDIENGQKPKYKFVSRKNLDKFVQYLLDYDGYIIGYNNISFDNPVIVYNSSFENKEEILQIINQKSIDLYNIYSKLFQKKIGLNSVASHIVGVSKTLDSGAEGSSLLKQYEETGDEKALQVVKNYCKNDVKMTLTILLYLLFIGTITYEDREIEVSIEDILKLGKLQEESKKVNTLFG